MATVYWLGAVQAVVDIQRITIVTATDGATYSVTTGGKTASFVAPTSSTTPIIAAGLLASIGVVAGLYPELRELTVIADPASTSALLVAGPADGTPFVMSVSPGPKITIASVVTPTGPNDLAATGNYSTAALPGAGDTLVFADVAQGPMNNLDALDAITLGPVVKRATFTGRWGRPSTSSNGYAEYRSQFLRLKSPTVTIEVAPSDVSEQLRWQSISSAAVTVTASGSSTNRFGTAPVVEFFGTPANSVLNAAGVSIGVAIRAAQVATLLTVTASDSAITIGPGVVSGGTYKLTNATGTLAASYAALTVSGLASAFTVQGSAAGASGSTNTVVNGGTLNWRSTGVPGDAVSVATGATFDLSLAPAVVAAFNLLPAKGATINNPSGRIGTPFNITPQQCAFSDVIYNGPAGEVHAVS